MQYLCKTKEGYTFVFDTVRDYSEYIGKSTYVSLGGDSFRVIQAINVLNSIDVVNLNVDYALAP